MTRPLITVLTAVHNGADHLDDAIQSIRGQSLTDFEHIIVDDASDDDSAVIVERAAAVDARIRLLRRDHRGGPYVAANDGLRVAAGTYIARIDADDVAPPDRLQVQLDFLTANAGFRACGGFHKMLTNHGLASRDSRFPTSTGFMRWRLTAAGGPTHSTAFVMRSAFEELGGYYPRPLAQDLRLWCQLAQRNWLGIVPRVVVYRRAHDESTGKRARSLQFQHAVEAARDHLHAISGEWWGLDEVRTLWHVIGRDPSAFPRGFEILDRWTVLWLADPKLTSAERRQLAGWTNRRRRLFAQACARDHPLAARIRVAQTKMRDIRLRLEARRAV